MTTGLITGEDLTCGMWCIEVNVLSRNNYTGGYCHFGWPTKICECVNAPLLDNQFIAFYKQTNYQGMYIKIFEFK